MDFQLARNLSALARAQQEAAQALLHIDCLSDCINREIIMSAASSEATEQLVVSARATLVQVQNMLATQSDEGARRLREAQVAFITTRRERSSSTSASHESDPDCQEPDSQVSEGRVALRKELLLVRDIPSRELPYEAAYGVMMSRDESEWVKSNSVVLFTVGDLWWPVLRYPFLTGLTDAG